MDTNDLDLADNVLTTQSYSPNLRIADVEIFPLKRFHDDGGSFLEVSRFSLNGEVVLSGKTVMVDSGTTPFIIQQINHSYVVPGVVKAWHLHFKQEDLWFVPPGDRLLVGLYDLRKDSKTLGREMRFVLGDGEGQILLIPRGVAHGCTNLGQREMQLMYLVNQPFSPDNPDENRLPWDALVGKEFWQLQHG